MPMRSWESVIIDVPFSGYSEGQEQAKMIRGGEREILREGRRVVTASLQKIWEIKVGASYKVKETETVQLQKEWQIATVPLQMGSEIEAGASRR